MLAYLFWHVPSPDIEPKVYETALLDFQADLASAPPPGFAACTSYRISGVPWREGEQGYEDWYFVRSSAALEGLNEAAVKPERWDVHAAVAGRMEFGQGGLYQHLYGKEQPLGGTRAVWLTRPRGIHYESALREMTDGSAGFLSCWRRMMVLGPAAEFAVIGTSELNPSLLPGWQARNVERTPLETAASPLHTVP